MTDATTSWDTATVWMLLHLEMSDAATPWMDDRCYYMPYVTSWWMSPPPLLFLYFHISLESVLCTRGQQRERGHVSYCFKVLLFNVRSMHLSGARESVWLSANLRRLCARESSIKKGHKFLVQRVHRSQQLLLNKSVTKEACSLSKEICKYKER